MDKIYSYLGLYSIVVSSKKSALVIENVQLDCFLPNNGLFFVITRKNLLEKIKLLIY